MQSLDFPEPENGDPSSVTSALEFGKREWDRGDVRDAVRWIRRAADAAEEAGDDGRALSLARVAADLMSSFDPSAAPSSSPMSSPPSPRDEGAALAPFDDFNDQTIVDAPAVMIARQSARAAQEKDERPREPRLTVVSSSTPQLRARSALRVAVDATSFEEGSFRVLVLSEGSNAPDGMTEAMLVMMDPDSRLPVDLVSGRATLID